MIHETGTQVLPQPSTLLYKEHSPLPVGLIIITLEDSLPCPGFEDLNGQLALVPETYLQPQEEDSSTEFS
jgi:hypothetical protein